MKHHSAIGRAATAATAALSVIALGAGPATAATAPAIFAGEADGLALRLSVKGPEQLFGPLTGGSDTLVLSVSRTGATLASNGDANVLATLLGAFGDQLGGPSVESDEDVDRTEQFQGIDAGPLSVDVGTVRMVLDRAGGLSLSESELAGVTVNLGPLLAELPPEVTEGLQTVVDQATENVNTLVGELNGGLDQLEEAVNQVTEQSPIDIPEVLPEDLPLVPDVTAVDLVSLRVLASTSTVETVDGMVRATSTGLIKEASLLGGVVNVPIVEFSSVAETAGTPGTASATTDVRTIAVEVGDTLVSIDGSVITVGDLTIDLTDPQFEGLPAEQVLGPIQDVLAQLLNAAGLSILQGVGTTDVAEDGSSASASTSALAIRVVPLAAAAGDDAPLDINLELAPTAAVVSAAPAVAPAPDPDPEEPALPRTGGGAATMLLGAIALGGAMGLRRRA
ncbi:MAG: hypothetical protein ACLGIR_09195 [Actinomycetes bacterium]